MHEVGIAKDLITSIQEQIKDREDVTQIKKVYIRLGKSMGVTEDSLKFWFGNLIEKTKLEGAHLEVSLVEGRGIFVDSLDVV